MKFKPKNIQRTHLARCTRGHVQLQIHNLGGNRPSLQSSFSFTLFTFYKKFIFWEFISKKNISFCFTIWFTLVQKGWFAVPKGVANSFGNISPLLLCVKMSTSLHFLNPFTLQCFFSTFPFYFFN